MMMIIIIIVAPWKKKKEKKKKRREGKKEKKKKYEKKQYFGWMGRDSETSLSLWRKIINTIRLELGEKFKIDPES